MIFIIRLLFAEEFNSGTKYLALGLVYIWVYPVDTRISFPEDYGKG